MLLQFYWHAVLLTIAALLLALCTGVCKKVKSFPSQIARSAVLISVSLAVSQTPLGASVNLFFRLHHWNDFAYCDTCNRNRNSGTRLLRSSAIPLLDVPFRWTSIGKRSFSCAAPATWNSLLPAVVNCDTLYISSIVTHVIVTVAVELGRCVHRPFHFSMCPSGGLASANDLLAALRLQLGTLCLLLSSTVTLCIFQSRLKTHLFNIAYS